MKNSKITNGNPLPDEVEINLNMLGSLMLNRVGGHVDSADVVTIDQRGALRSSMKLKEKLVQPSGFGNTIGHYTILRFSTRSGDCILPLRRPGNQVVPQKNCITQCGFVCIQTACPVSIRVYCQLTLRRRTKKKPQV